MSVNFLASFAAIPMLKYFGRRSLLIATFFVCTVSLVTIALFEAPVIALLATVIFVIMFELGPGPICWIYMSEIMNEKGVAVGTFLNWTFTWIFSFATTPLFEATG